MTEGPENLVLHLLGEMRAEMATKSELASVKSDLVGVKSDLVGLRAELKSDMHSLRADVAADLIVTRKELGEQIGGLRRAVVEYHSTVIGHGVLISELEARVRRLEINAGLALSEAN